MEPRALEWSAPEFEYRHKGISWYWASIIFAVLVLGFAVWQGNFLFGVFVIVAEILILVWSTKKPGFAKFAATEKKLTINEKKSYAWNELESFSFDEEEDDEWVSIAINFRSRVRPTMRIGAPRGRTGEIADYFEQFIPRVEEDPSFIDSLERFIRF